jgi:hypothetical protein
MILRTKGELLQADLTYRTVIAMQKGDPDAPDHDPNDEEIAGSMIRAYGDNAIEHWLQLQVLHDRYPEVIKQLKYALDPANYK